MDPFAECPMRCPSCATTLSNKIENARKELVAAKEEEIGKILVKHGIRNYCCETKVISSINLVDGIQTA